MRSRRSNANSELSLQSRDGRREEILSTPWDNEVLVRKRDVRGGVVGVGTTNLPDTPTDLLSDDSIKTRNDSIQRWDGASRSHSINWEVRGIGPS